MTDRPLSPSEVEKLRAWTRAYPYPEMGLIEALREIQNARNFISLEAEARVAEVFQVPLHQVHEVVTFYPYFTTRPAGKHRISVCSNLSCRLVGCKKALEHLRERLGVGEGEATADGLLAYEAVECLGACDHAPAFAVDDELMGAASAERLDAVLADAKAGRPIEAPASAAGPALGPAGLPRLLTEHFKENALHRLETYRRLGGYSGWEKARSMTPQAITAEVKKSNLRGLGGAGFPTGMKWETVPSKAVRKEPHFLVANADESEPGCFKDRVLMERNPHALIEGLLITGRAVDADELFIFIRGEYARQYRVLAQALAEAREAGFLGPPGPEILLMRGANAYISGCDTALLETMEGKKAWPRQPPPFPTGAGLKGHPTVVNNVETLMMAACVLREGAEAFAKLGVPKSGGTCVFSVSGHVEKPGVYEFPMGAPLMDLLAAAGGMKGGRPLKAVIPGGTSTPVLTAEEARGMKMDFDSLRGAGSFLGAGGVIFLDDSVDMVEVLSIIEHFLWHESCGQCTPCREGSGWLYRILSRILSEGAAGGDVENIVRIGENVAGRVICALGDTVGMAAKAMAVKFKADFEKRLIPGGRHG